MLTRFLSKRATSEVLGHPRDLLTAERLGFGGTVAAGVEVDEFNALTLSSVWSAVRVIVEPTAFLPFHVFERMARGKRRAIENPVDLLINDRPNPDMSAQTFRETLTAHTLTWGNGFARIERDGRKEPIGLWPRRPSQMTLTRRADRSLWYHYEFTGGGSEDVPAMDMLHVPGLGWDGIIGYPVIVMARESLGLAMATERFGAKFFGSGARQGGILSHPQELSELARNNIAKSIREKRTGEDNWHDPWILEEGMTWTATTIPPDDAQFLETRKFQVEEVGRWFRVQPHLLGVLDGAIRANIEAEGIDFVRYTLKRWLRAWEHEVDFKLLGGNNRRFFSKHNTDEIVRGDSVAQNASFIAGRQNGWWSVNDILEKMDENPIKGKGGDEHHIQLNMVPLESADEPRGTPPAPAPDSDSDDDAGDDEERTAVSRETRIEKMETRVSARQARAVQQRLGIQRAHRTLFVGAAKGIVSKEIKNIRAAAKKFLKDPANPNGFLVWLTEFYDDHHTRVTGALSGPVEALGDSIYRAVVQEVGGEDAVPESVRAFFGDYVEKAADRETSSGLGQMRAIVGEVPSDDPEGLRNAIGTRLDEWDERRADKFGIREVAQAASAIAVASFVAGGVERLMWVNTGAENCPICEELDGRIVGVTQTFVSKGDRLGSQDQKFQAGHSFMHPPIHDGCDCQIVSA